MKKKLCAICNHQSKLERKANRHQPTAKKLSGQEKIKVFSSLKRKFKPTGELSFFRTLLQQRPHRSELSGTPIHNFDIWNFGHILSKAAFPKFRLNPENIILLTKDEHIRQHNGTLDEKYKIILKEKAEILKQKYYAENFVDKK